MPASRRLLHLARHHRGLLAASVAVGLVITATYAGQGVALAASLARLLDGRPLGSIVGPVVVVALGQVVRAGALWWREVLGMRISGAVRTDLRQRLYGHLLDLGPAHLVGTRTGDATATVVDQVEAIDPYFSRFLPQVVASAVSALVLVAAVVWIDPVVGAVVVAAVLGALSAPRLSRRMWQRASGRWQVLYNAVYSNALDAVQGMATLKAFNAHDRWGSRLHTESQAFNQASVRLLLAASTSGGVAGFASGVGTAVAVGVGALRLADGALTTGELLVVLLLVRECFRPVQDLERAFHAAYAAPAAAAGIFELLDTPVAVEEPDPACSAPADGSLAFESVTFRHRGAPRPALADLTLHVAPGETVALVGTSGAGKTTAVSLLQRWFDPDAGRVLVGGHDARTWSRGALRRHVAVVAQEPYLFGGSVRDNLLLARPDATDEQLHAALHGASAFEFVAALPHGIDTIVGERGVRLSGGERQRLAIARALVADAPFLVLDEATSAVDGTSEAAIQAALDRLTRDRTTVVVAHRLSTVRTADRVAVLEAGRLVEVGSPDELLAAGGPYAELVAAQVAQEAGR